MFNASGNRVRRIPPAVFAQFRQLQALVLSDNEISEVPPTWLKKGLLSLNTLVLSHNKVCPRPPACGVQGRFREIRSFGKARRLFCSLYIGLCCTGYFVEAKCPVLDVTFHLCLGSSAETVNQPDCTCENTCTCFVTRPNHGLVSPRQHLVFFVSQEEAPFPSTPYTTAGFVRQGC